MRSRLLLSLILGHSVLVILPTAHGQRYILKDNTTLEVADVTLVPGFLVQQVKIASGGSFERRFPLADVVRLDFPVPEALTTAEQLVAAGQGTEALAALDPIYRQFAPFPKTAGSPWPRAAELRLQALLLGTDQPAITAAAQELMRSGLGPEVTGTAKLALAQLDARAGREALANVMLEEIVREAPPAVQARAWLLRGDLAAARSAHEEALEAYLRLPAFYGTLDALQPAALLGAARAYKGFGDIARAERAALELIDGYPSTAQATEARREFGF